jgi:hypothetical protein
MIDHPNPIAFKELPQFRLTLAILVTLILEAIAGLLWVGAAAQRLDELELESKRQQPILERIARIEAELGGVRASLVRIENNMDREVP